MMTETVINVQGPNNHETKPHQLGTPNQGNAGNQQLALHLEYFKTNPGILKLVEVVFGILCMALASPAYYSSTHFFLFVATTSFILTILWIFVYLLGIREALRIPINWILSELFNTGFWAVMYIIACILQLVAAVGTIIHPLITFRDAYIAAGVFGLFNAIVYSFATYLLYLEYNRTRSTN